MKNTKLNYSELKISKIASNLGREMNVEILELEKETEGLLKKLVSLGKDKS